MCCENGYYLKEKWYLYFITVYYKKLRKSTKDNIFQYYVTPHLQRLHLQ